MQRSDAGMKNGTLSRAAGVIFLFVIAGCCAVVYRQDVVAAAINALPVVDLGQPHPWLIDWRLTALKFKPERCQRVLIAPHISALSIVDNPLQNGCGWQNSFRMQQAGGVRASFDKITCEAAAALALWLEHDVQAAAREILNARVVAVQSLGAYSCRNIIGSLSHKDWRSQHATANAIDIAGFTLADGRTISVRSQWRGDTSEARFLKSVHARACRYFHVVLGPDYNQAHRDHFHLDRGPLQRCR